MTGGLSILGRQLTELWGHFGVRQKFSTIMALILTVIAIGGLLYWSSRPCYRLLCTGMELEEAAKAQVKLEEARILVQLRDSGHALYVPAADLNRSRLLLAKAGIPKNNNVGFEMFSEPKFGLTEFAQQVNYQRALQGELQNTIMAMDGISSARVTLALPKEKLFSSDQERRPTASIMVSVAAPLSSEQVRSLTHLVSASVPGLRIGDITITDQNGRLMSRGSNAENEPGADATGQMEIRAKIEESLARKGQRILDMALGSGRSTVQVSADLDFSKLEKEREILDSEGRVVSSESISSETTSSPAGGEGRTASVSVANPAGGDNAAKTKKEDINTKYQIPRSMERIHEVGARIRGLSVSVCIAADKQPRSAEALAELKKKVTAMVGAAVGIVQSDTRKDSIAVEEMSFPEPAVTTAATAATDWHGLVWEARNYASPVALVVISLIVLFLLRKRAVAGLDIESRDAGMPLRSLTTMDGSAGAAMNRIPAAGAHGNDMDMITSLAEQEPKTLATWIASVNQERK
jgi:flagellar M-ring protein FliF